jgi:hypothetical protein
VKNRLDLEISLHSRQIAMTAGKDISKELRNKIFEKEIEEHAKACDIINEASIIYKKGCFSNLFEM